jgi:hypothetical protein
LGPVLEVGPELELVLVLLWLADWLADQLDDWGLKEWELEFAKGWCYDGTAWRVDCAL